MSTTSVAVPSASRSLAGSSIDEPGYSTVVPFSDDDVSTLFRSTYSRLCQTIAQMLRGDRSGAEQVVMDAFRILYERRNAVRPETASAYLWKIALNEARTVAARTGREMQLVHLSTRRGDLPGEELDPAGNDADRGVDYSHVRQLVDHLPPDQRVVVVLHYYCDWPDADIAEVLGCPAVTVRSRLRRARLALERQLRGSAA